MIKIWLNHWFSTVYNVIDMLKKADPELYIICTNQNEKNVISAICDEMYIEPDLKGDEYADFCIKFRKEHKINIFMPRREMLSISKHKADFEDIGVKVMVDDYDTISVLNNKDQAYKMLSEKGISTIPEYCIAASAPEFAAAYNKLATRYKEICIKFVHDEGGKSFRLIDNERKGYTALFKKQNTRMTFESILDSLSEREHFSPLIVMPYLPGVEISADCLNTDKGLIMLPRIKDSSRIERICFDDEILDKVQEVYDAVNLEYPCNIQFKYLDGKPWFLEVNTLMSGGIQMSCAATGVNLPYIAVCKMLGKEQDWNICREEKYVTHIEVPIVL